MSLRKRLKYATVLLPLLLHVPTIAVAANKADDPMRQLLTLSLKELANVKVTSVSKKEENLKDAAAAIYVITAEDIKRSGLTTVPEILRLAPGVQVARAGASRWSISVRGFNGQFANKLLVLIDGRTVYTPVYAGVYWDQQDTLIEDIDRIEVIRGPGATLWGANAVNGVINIITKKASDTQGTLVTMGYGNEERGFASGRYGSKLKNGYYRTYLKYFDRDGIPSTEGQKWENDWSAGRGGFRADWNKSSDDEFTAQGDVYSGREEVNLKIPTISAPFFNAFNDDEEVAGGNVLTRWKHTFANASQSVLQVYYDVVARNGESTSSQDVRTTDVDFQHNWHANQRNEITWGLGYRNISDELGAASHFNFNPRTTSEDLFSAFIQDKITLKPDTLFLTLGSKFEHNKYTGFEYQPSGRISWLIDDKQTLWASIARAVRVPNRAMDSISFVVAGTPIGLIRLVGNHDVESENLIAYETGYRIKPTETLSFDIAAFYNDYEDLASNQLLTPLIAQAANGITGRSYGAELTADWNVNASWELSATYSFINMRMDHGIETNVNTEKRSPAHQAGIHSHLVLSQDIELDNSLYYIGKLKSIDTSGYIRFDTKLTWKASERLSFNVVGQNLLQEYHQEFIPNFYEAPVKIGRSAYAQVTYKF